MATPVLAVVRIPCLDGVAKDVAETTWAFSDYDTGIEPALVDFYNHANTFNSLWAYHAGDRDTGAGKCSVDIYDLTTHLDGSPHGVPIEHDSWTLGGHGGSNTLPNSVAMVMSFHSLITYGGRKRARQHGRVFLGPLDGSAATTYDSTTHELRPSANFMTDIGVAANRLYSRCQANNPSKPTPWAVWSRRDAAMHNVTGGWVDNRLDSQRRRMTPATTRTTWL